MNASKHKLLTFLSISGAPPRDRNESTANFAQEVSALHQREFDHSPESAFGHHPMMTKTESHSPIPEVGAQGGNSAAPQGGNNAAPQQGGNAAPAPPQGQSQPNMNNNGGNSNGNGQYNGNSPQRNYSAPPANAPPPPSKKHWDKEPFHPALMLAV